MEKNAAISKHARSIYKTNNISSRGEKIASNFVLNAMAMIDDANT